MTTNFFLPVAALLLLLALSVSTPLLAVSSTLTMSVTPSIFFSSAENQTGGRGAAGAELSPSHLRDAVVTITEVQRPWYAFRFIIKGRFEQAVPEYTAISGLLQKNFALSDDGKSFGGIYLWRTKASADAWFTPAWFKRTQEQYGKTGKVSTFRLLSYTAYNAVPKPTGGYWSVLHRGSQKAIGAVPPAGLLHAYRVSDEAVPQEAGITLWRSKDDAKAYFQSIGVADGELAYFDTPVLINNLQSTSSAVSGQ
jgi:heme-degrading monooxygenase HmoA